MPSICSTQHGWTKRAADMRYNLAWLAARRGDLVEAFRRFDAAEQAYESLGVSGAAMCPDRGEALLAAGLTEEAVALAEQAAAELRAQGDDVDLAETLMLVARAALLAGDNDRAASGERRGDGAVLAPGPGRLVGGGGVTGRRGTAARRVRRWRGRGTDRRSDRGDPGRRAGAGLRARRGSLRPSSPPSAGSGTPRDATSTPSTGPSSAWPPGAGSTSFGRASWLLDERADDALAACAAAVDEFGELTAELGGTELRAHVALHVAELVATGLELAVQRGDPAARVRVERAAAGHRARVGTRTPTRRRRAGRGPRPPPRRAHAARHRPTRRDPPRHDRAGARPGVDAAPGPHPPAGAAGPPGRRGCAGRAARSRT